MNPNTNDTILVIGDLHAPFVHKDTLDFLELVKDEYEPDIVVCLGDELDNHAISYHESDPDGHSAGKELELAQLFMSSFYELFPEGYSCTSNHSELFSRKARTHGLPSAVIKNLSEILRAPTDWQWADSWEFAGIKFEHGMKHGGKYAHIAHAMHNMQSSVIGHLHSIFAVDYFANESKIIFGAGAGCFVDHKSYAFRYGKNFARKPILGCLVIENGIPKLIPMLLDNKGDWLGTI